MYQGAGSLDLDYMKQQHLSRCYESEEEEISESEHGGQDHTFSPVRFYKSNGTFSDTSIDGLSNGDMDSDKENIQPSRLLLPFQRTSRPRPVSMDTIKRNSDTTFVADSLIFDNDDVIELPSSDQTSPLASPIFLQPTVYVPESPLSSESHFTRSPSPTSLYSDDETDETDVLVAEKVTYLGPITKPNLILISPEQSSFPLDTSDVKRQSSHKRSSSYRTPETQNREGVYSLKQATKSQPSLSLFPAKTNYRSSVQLRVNVNRLERRPPGSREGPHSATIRSLREVPEIPQPMSPRMRSATLAGSRISISERVPALYSAVRSRFPREALRRPPSMRSLSSGNLLSSGSRQNTSSSSDDAHHRSMSTSQSYMSPDGLSASQMCHSPSPSPSFAPHYCSSPSSTRARSGSLYSSHTISVPAGNRTPLPVRESMMNSSMSSYTNSLRSEMEGVSSPDQHDAVDHYSKPNSNRRKTLKLSKPPKTESKETSPTKSSFMNFMLKGKRKSTVWNYSS